MNVGIRELKQRLSEYVERVARGEVIRITHRGHVKALLMPAPDDRIVARGVEEGWLAPGEEGPPQPVRRARSRLRALELLREDREGR